MDNIKEGHKQTKVGIIPEEWEVVRLGEILSIGSGKDYKHLNKGDIPVYGTGGKMLYVDDFLYDGESVCIGRKGTIDKPQFLSGKFWTVDTLFYTHSFKDTIPKFIYFVFLQINWKKFNEASGVPSLSKTTIESLKIKLPPLKEQQKIAEILTTWDEAISKQEALITEKEQLKKGLMQKLLSGEVQFEGFDGEWEETALKKVLKERKTFLEKGLDLEHVSLSTEGVVPKSARYERDFLVKDDNKKYKITRLNDICYNPANLKFGVICRNTLGDGIFSPIYVTFEVKKDFDIGFISYLLTWNNFIQRVRKYEQGTVYERMAVSPQDFLRFKIKIPSLNKQQKIAQVLTTADKEIELLKKELEALKEQKRGLMQKLLTGEVRVRV